jgi:hypothetical protein
MRIVPTAHEPWGIAMKPMRLAAAALLSLSLAAPSFAADAGARPLAPGKPVGTRNAAMLGSLGVPLIAIGGFAALAAIIATTVGQSDTPVATTTGTSS